MPVRSSRPALVARALLVAAVGAAALVSTAAAEARPTPAAGLGCLATDLTDPVRLDAALGEDVSAAAVAQHNVLDREELAHLAEDETSWLDTCGQVFVVDEALPARLQEDTDVVSGPVPDDVFDLSSKPSSPRTIYLDFDGATHSGTKWDDGAQIVSPAYSIDADPATFTATERAQIHLAWQVVAEDFASFDVNVTTRPPAASALTRTSAADPTYGMPVVITPTNSVGSDCDCGGVAYVGVFGRPNATDHQPAWIFTNGSGTGGYNVGQVISHEVGHTLGLSHDGAGQADYSAGAKGWGPIMGASYNRRASHWSSGEYADANNPEDDVAIIARTAPVLADDHGNAAARATPLTAGVPVAGTITSRTDVDAFSFTASGPTTLTVAGPAGVSNVDAQLTVYTSAGQKIASVDPVADIATDESMAATWTADLPATATGFTAVVDGVGHGDPREAGRYSDYGSIGAYTVSLATGTATEPVPPTPTPTPTPPPTPPTSAPTPTAIATAGAPTATTTPDAGEDHASGVEPIGFLTTRLPKARVGGRYHAVIRFTGPVLEARVDWRLPTGLRWRVAEDRIVITGKVARRSANRFASILSGEDTSVRRQFRIVVR